MCAGNKICDEKIVRRLLFGALVGSIIMAVKVFEAMKPYYILLPILELNASKISISSSNHVDFKNPITSKLSNTKTDVYEINGDVRIHGLSSTIFIASNHDQNSSSWTIQPHPRKQNFGSMSGVKNFKVIIRAPHKTPPCSRNYINTPAILFSTGGIAGHNYFHSFSDVLIPLFLTSHRFNQTAIFLMSNYTLAWTSKYRFVIEKLSKFDVYDIDTENEVLCFSKVIVGLEAYDDLEMNDTSAKFVRRDFMQLLQLKYVESRVDPRHQPRMLIISRQKTRKLLNEREIGDEARALGFDVVVREFSTNVTFVTQYVNSFDVMVGVHGAGLTNMIFLRENAIVIQIVPFGVDYLSWLCFKNGMKSNKLKDLSYNVSLSESSLLGKYPPNSTIYKNPQQILETNFPYYSTIYLQNQDVKLDLNRFRGTLLKALELLSN